MLDIAPPEHAEAAAAHGLETRSASDGLYLVGGILLAAALIAAIVVAWNAHSAQGPFNMHQAETLLGHKQYSASQALLEQNLLIYESPQERLDLSYVYLARRDADRAERQVRIVINEAPPQMQAAAWCQLGRVLAFAGRTSEALDAWTRAREMGAPYSDNVQASAEARSALWHTAMLHWSQSEWQVAEQELDSLAAGTDLYGQSAKVKLAQLLAPTQPDLVLPAIDSQATEQAAIPDLRVPGLEEGLTIEEMQQLVENVREAQATAKQTSDSGTNGAALDTVWGGSYLQQGENALALSLLQKAVASDASYEPAHARLALALLNAGKDENALAETAAAAKLDANDPLPHHVLASFYIQQGQWDQAKEELTTLENLEPNSVDVYLQWASYYQLQGDYDDAEDRYIEAANMQLTGVAAPTGTNAPLALSRFYTDVRGFGCEKGLPAARETLALHPDDPASFDAIGWALMLCNQPKDALSGLEGAVKAAPDVPRYRLHLAKAYKALGRYADARTQYTWVLDLDPGGPLERLALDDLVTLPR